MTEHSHDGSAERSVVIGLIVSDIVLSKLAPKWDKAPLRSPWANTIADWCVSYYKKHQSAPKKTIESLFSLWAENTTDEETKKTVSRFLSQLSKQYESLNDDLQPPHVIETATKLLNDVRMERMMEDVEARIKRGDTSGAVKIAKDFREVQVSEPDYIDLFRDKDAQRLALEDRQNVLIRYDGGAGEFFGEELSEDSFVAFLAPPKSAKSFLLMDLAWTAVRQKRKVAYFQVGDLTKGQIIRRFHKRAARRPLGPGVIQWPISLVAGKDGIAQVEHEDRVFDEPISIEFLQERWQNAVKKHKSQRFRLKWFPSKSVSITDIRNILEEWDQAGWKAQVVIIDYSDNLLSASAKKREDLEVEETWTMMRQISEIRKCLMVTATQVASQGFGSWVLTKKHFSRSKMILATVTAFAGINQTPEEQSRDVRRLNWINSREGKISEYRCCHIASCLGISQAIVLSQFP